MWLLNLRKRDGECVSADLVSPPEEIEFEDYVYCDLNDNDSMVEAISEDTSVVYR